MVLKKVFPLHLWTFVVKYIHILLFRLEFMLWKAMKGLFALDCGSALWEINRWLSPTELNKQYTLIITCPDTHSCKPYSKKELTVIRFSLPVQRKDINSLKGDEETPVQNINGSVCTQRYGMWHITGPDRKLQNCLHPKMGWEYAVCGVTYNSLTNTQAQKASLQTLCLTTCGCFWEIYMKRRSPHSIPCITIITTPCLHMPKESCPL